MGKKNPPRPDFLPASACEFVEKNLDSLLQLAFYFRLNTGPQQEDSMIQEIADLIYQLARADMLLPMHKELQAISVECEVLLLPLYVALAFYAKHLWTKHTQPPAIVREDIDQEVYYRLA